MSLFRLPSDLLTDSLSSNKGMWVKTRCVAVRQDLRCSLWEVGVGCISGDWREITCVVTFPLRSSLYWIHSYSSREKQETLLELGAIVSVVQIPDITALVYVIPSQVSAFSRKASKYTTEYLHTNVALPSFATINVNLTLVQRSPLMFILSQK